VFASENIEVVLTLYRAPNANAYAERWVRSVREECLDHLLISNERHLEHVLREYCQYYNQARPREAHWSANPRISTPQARTRSSAAERCASEASSTITLATRRKGSKNPGWSFRTLRGTRRVHLAGCTAWPTAASRGATSAPIGVEAAGPRASYALSPP
jgi:hypothetical protein